MTGTSRFSTIRRRSVTISLHVFLLLLSLATFAAWLPLCVVVDAASRGRLALSRCGLFLTLFLSAEVFGVLVAFALYCLRPIALRGDRYVAANFRLQCFWARTLFRGVQRLFNIHVEVEGSEVCAQGPLLLLMRHVSVGDTLFPAIFVSDRFGIRLRYVLKRELLWDPCLDIVGQRLRNAFVRRGEAGADAQAVGDLADDLGPRDGVLIFPEGTRFTPRKRQQVRAKLVEKANNVDKKQSEEADEIRKLLAATEGMHHVLPPRLGGALALLERAKGVDAVLCAHTGFEGISTLRDLYTGSLVGRRVHVRFWRIPHQDIPTSVEEQTEWLLDEWQRVDAFVAQRQLAS